MSDDRVNALLLQYPFVKWHEPIPIAAGEASGLGCRICISLHGLKGGEVSALPKTNEEFIQHMQETHGLLM